MEQQLADIATLGDEEEREELQEMITEVKCDRGKRRSTCDYCVMTNLSFHEFFYSKGACTYVHMYL